MNGLQKSGWKYWGHFQVIHPGASAKGRNAFSAARAVLDQTLDSGLPFMTRQLSLPPMVLSAAHQWLSTPLILATRGIFPSPRLMEMSPYYCHHK